MRDYRDGYELYKRTYGMYKLEPINLHYYILNLT